MLLLFQDSCILSLLPFLLLLPTSIHGSPFPENKEEANGNPNDSLNNFNFQFNVNDRNAAARQGFFGEHWPYADPAAPSTTTTTTITRVDYVYVTRETGIGEVDEGKEVGQVLPDPLGGVGGPRPPSSGSSGGGAGVVGDDGSGVGEGESRPDEKVPGTGDADYGNTSPATDGDDGVGRDIPVAEQQEEAQQQLADELADVQTYLDILAMRLGVDLGRATMAKFGARLSAP